MFFPGVHFGASPTSRFNLLGLSNSSTDFDGENVGADLSSGISNQNTPELGSEEIWVSMIITSKIIFSPGVEISPLGRSRVKYAQIWPILVYKILHSSV